MKNIIITGANGNLGLVVTEYFLARGYRVIATVISQEMTGDFAPHQNLNVRVVDLTNEGECNSFIEECISSFENIYAALMLAGGFAMGKFSDTPIHLIRSQCTINFETAYNISRPLVVHMKESGDGRLIFIGAKPALKAEQGKDMLAYGLSKSLLFKLAEYINEDAKDSNVTATVIVPSTIDTPSNRKALPDADPSRWVDPKELASIMEFIVSEKSKSLKETVLKVYNKS